jgi:hypothetical protein
VRRGTTAGKRRSIGKGATATKNRR